MAKAGDVLEMEPLGCRVQLIRTADETNGELVEFDVLGRPRGFLVQSHVHTGQVERYEVMAGTLKIVEKGREHLLGPGETMEVPAGVAHRQVPGDKSPDGHVRVQVRPAGSTQAFLERVAAHVRGGRLQPLRLPQAGRGRQARDRVRRRGPRRAPVAARPAGALAPRAARRRAHAPLRLRRRVGRRRAARGGLRRHRRRADLPRVVAPGLPRRRRRRAGRAGQGVAPALQGAPPLPPAHALARRRARGAAHGDRGGRRRPARPRDVDADATATGTHVRFDWQVHADRRLLKALTPVLRPVFRWNHNWAIARAMEGLEPYARRTA